MYVHVRMTTASGLQSEFMMHVTAYILDANFMWAVLNVLGLSLLRSSASDESLFTVRSTLSPRWGRGKDFATEERERFHFV